VFSAAPRPSSGAASPREGGEDHEGHAEQRAVAERIGMGAPPSGRNALDVIQKHAPLRSAAPAPAMATGQPPGRKGFRGRDARWCGTSTGGCGGAARHYLLLRRDEVSLCTVNPGFPEELCLRATRRILIGWWRGDLTFRQALDAGLVLEGRREWVRAFPTWFERYLFAAVAPAALAAPAAR